MCKPKELIEYFASHIKFKTLEITLHDHVLTDPRVI